MKALVLYELHFYRDRNGEYWSKRVVDYKFLDRYLNVFERISICARVSQIEQNDGTMMKVSGPNVSFVDLPDTMGISETLPKLSIMKRILKKAIKEHDAIILRVPSMLTILLYHEIKKAGIPYSADVALSGTNMIPKKGFIWDRANKLIDKRLKKICMEANGVSYVTEHVLQQAYPCRAMKEPDNPDYFTGSFSTIELNDEDFFPCNWIENDKPDRFILVHCGYMDDDRKCHANVIRAVKKVIDRGFNVEIRFIGDGALRKSHEALASELGIADYCKFYGLITNKDKVLSELRKCHLFVFPTKAEGLPRSVLEAMAQGLPCISSPVDGVPELISDDCLVDWWDIDGYADKICEFLSDWSKMIQVGNRNYNKALEYHNDILKQKRRSFYQKLYNLCEK